MKKYVLLILSYFIVSVCAVRAMSGDGTADNPYKIGSASDLLEFASVVNGSHSAIERNTSACAVLMQDVSLNDSLLDADRYLNTDVLDTLGNVDTSKYRMWIPIALDSLNPYKGVFDGNSYSISGMLIKADSSDYCGLFSYTDSVAVLRNIIIKDAYMTANQFNGMICGCNRGLIENCENYGFIDNCHNYSGGIVGLNFGKVISSDNYGLIIAEGGICGYNQNGLIQNCTNYGNVNTGSYYAGICGTMKGGMIDKCVNRGAICHLNIGSYYAGICGEFYGGTISNCINAGVIGTKSTTTMAGICSYQNGGEIISCMEISGCANPFVAQGNNSVSFSICKGSSYSDNSGSFTLTDKQFATGYACYLLNQKSCADSVVWGQELGIDSLPVYGGTKIYSVSSVCPSRFSNQLEFSDLGHDTLYCQCQLCGMQTGTFDIYTADDLYEFAEAVNHNNHIDARLMADIIVNDTVLDASTYELVNSNAKAWNAISTYYGNFDGQYHKISGLYTSGSTQYMGLFAFNCGSIKNLGIVNSYFRGRMVGAVCGVNKGLISQCYSDCNIRGSAYSAGIVGKSDGNSVVRDCYNLGDIYYEAAGIVGWQQNSHDSIINCYAINSFEVKSDGISGYRDLGKVVNCYTRTKDTQGNNIDESIMMSGELCYLLNNKGQNHIWTQKIGVDPYPVFCSAPVYVSPNCSKYFSNSKDDSTGHDFVNCVCQRCGVRDSDCVCVHVDNEGKCIYCGIAFHDFENCYCRNCGEKDTTCNNHVHDFSYGTCVCGLADSTDTEKWYEIHNLDELLEFVRIVNSGRKKINGRLVNDIVVNDIEWDIAETGDLLYVKNADGINVWNPIKEYSGIFDGDGHVISGLYMRDAGLFKKLSGAEIRNVGIENSIAYNTGMFAYRAETTNFFNCHTAGKINQGCGFVLCSTDNYQLQETDTACIFSNCYNTADIYYANAGITCFIGKGLLVMDRCWNSGLMKYEGNCGGLVFIGESYSAYISNCYNVGDVIKLINPFCEKNSENFCGGIVGEGVIEHLYLSNCYNTGLVQSSYPKGELVANYADGLSEYNFGDTSNAGYHKVYYDNCYFLENCNKFTDSSMVRSDSLSIKAMSAASFADGEVCYKLNRGITDGSQPYRQNIDETKLRSYAINFESDSYPVLDTLHLTVFFDSSLFYYNYKIETDKNEHFSQTANPVVYTSGKTVFVRGFDGNIMVIDILGRVIYTSSVDKDDLIEFSVPSVGVYSVLINGNPLKVIVK